MTILTHLLAASAGAIITAICMAALVAGRSMRGAPLTKTDPTFNQR